MKRVFIIIKLCSSIILLLVILSGCAFLYFRPAGSPPYPPPRYTLNEWPYKDYWTGIVFNGRKIGFSHLALNPSKENGGLYEIRAEAVFLLRLLGVSKKVILKSIVDATHIKLLEGETAADCLPLIQMVGRLRSRIISFSH